MKAIILAAGEGKRLRPLTLEKPKCMVELFGKSLLQHQIDIFKSCSIDDISIVTGYKNNLINIEGVKFFENPDYERTNMVETMFCAKKELTDSVIISYGDIIFEKNVLKKLISNTDEISVIVDSNWESYWKKRFSNPLDDAESLVLDNDDFIINIGQKVLDISEICGQFIGLIKFQNSSIPDIVNFYEKSRKMAELGINPLNSKLPFQKSYMTDFLQGMINFDFKLKAIKTSNGWLELDTLNDFNLYNEMNSNGTLDQFYSISN